MKQSQIEIAKQQIKMIITDALGRLVASGTVPSEPLPAFTVESTNDSAHGDFATNVSLVCAKTFHKSPRDIANLLVAEIDLTESYFEKVEAAGPGFINFFLNDFWFASTVKSVIKQGDDYGKTDYGKNKSVLIEFVSANPTGPMHIGNARGGAIGDTLASVLSYAGYDAKREFYVNDAGNQIEKFATSLEVRYLQLYKSGIEMPEDAYHGADITAHAENFAKEFGDGFVDSTPEERRNALVEFALPKNIEGLRVDLERYRIIYDNWFLESSVHKSGDVGRVIEKFKESGYTYSQDGALWFKATEFGCDQDFVLVRSNGIPTYVVPDIAYHYNKLVTRNFDTAIDILGADHHGYVPRMKAALKALGIDENRLKVIIMQMVRLVKDGDTYKLSKRSGKAITLNDLLDEVPIDAARFFFNLRDPNTHLDFDIDLAISESSSNPVYYCQYAYARICSIINNMKDEGVEIKDLSENELTVLSTPEEQALIRFIAKFPDEINMSAKELDPSKMTRYCLELAGLFHKFYTVCRVKGMQENILQARLNLLLATKITLKNLLTLLKINTPEKM